MLTIIIPIYNAAKYLHHCVGSLIKHVKCEYEIILVDDGSYDGSETLCDEYTRIYENISALHQANNGVCSARNKGIEQAKGEWIWMVDADDYIENDIKHEDLVDESQLITIGCTWEENGDRIRMVGDKADIPYNTWRCIFKRDIIKKNNIRFTEGRKYAEDQEFIHNYLFMIETKNINSIDKIIYHYTSRPGSAMTKPGTKFLKIKDILIVLFGIFTKGIIHKRLLNLWVIREIKRMIKVLIVIAVRP